jgi:Bifunctional DNA primase/polymerase, N-terminal/Primase C terminal 1 (PriCT-1)
MSMATRKPRAGNQLTSPMEGAAFDYAARGWSVIPIEAHGKRPIVAWQEFQRRIATSDEIADWFRRWPRANVAIVTGAVSGLVVLDIDPQHGGADSVAELEAMHDRLPPTVAAATGGGGRHLYFLHPRAGVRNKVGLAPGIDVRADGGCVVAPPSTHPSGRRYVWIHARAPDELPLAPLPGWLHALIRDGGNRPGHPLAHWRELARDGVREGQRNNTIASFAGHLLWHGVDPEVVLHLLLAWNRSRCVPPLPDDEVARVVESIVRLHEQDSSNVQG